MGEQRSGRTTKMLIEAIRYAADHPGCAILVCTGKEHQARQMRMKAGKLARAMGFETGNATLWSFRIWDSQLHFRPTARSKQHAQSLADDKQDVMVFHDHTSSGELEN